MAQDEDIEKLVWGYIGLDFVLYLYCYTTQQEML